ncbi:MAG: BatD family protein, partial [Halioglobus sp.]|nr:BatD family protein [Halioglobus sp.]
TQAASIRELQDSGQLRIASSLEPAADIVPGQQVQFVMEIATATWFTGGVRISVPEVSGLVILQTEQFAANASELRDGKTWVLQRWSLDVYPQTAGSFRIPPVALELSVAGPNGNSVTGTASAPGAVLEAAVPVALEAANSWVAAPEFSVSQRFDRALENLAVGEAFAREITFRASDLMAMMLPEYRPARMTGLRAYPEPAALENNTNRGESRATRVERISYVAEQPGDYLLPALDYYWWNTRTAQLEVLSLEPTRVVVTGAVASAERNRAAPDLRRLLVPTASLVLALAFAWLIWRYAAGAPWGRLQQAVQHTLKRLQRAWRAARKPALPARLNPDGSAED